MSVSPISDFQTYEMGDTHVYFIKPVAPTPRSEPSELQNLHRNSAAGLPQKNAQSERNDIMLCITNNATDDWCKRL